jgi:putative endonuclease
VEPGSTRAVGAEAEQIAFRYLCQQGLKPVARNFQTRRGEIDLIMLDEICLAFIEVRYRTRNSLISSVYTVDEHKQRKLGLAAAQFLSGRRAFQNHRCRFDVIGIDRDERNRTSINWMRDAFRPGI